EQGGTDGDQHVGPEARGLVAELAIEADHAPQAGREQQAEDQSAHLHPPMIAYFVPVGAGRFAMYSEPGEPVAGPRAGATGTRGSHRLMVRWHGMVDEARQAEGGSRWVRWRHAAVRRLAESVSEQRTLWHLRAVDSATLRFPATIPESEAKV